MTIGLSREEIGELTLSIVKEWAAEGPEPPKFLSVEEVVARLTELLGRVLVTMTLENNQKIETDLRAFGLIPD